MQCVVLRVYFIDVKNNKSLTKLLFIFYFILLLLELRHFKPPSFWVMSYYLYLSFVGQYTNSTEYVNAITQIYFIVIITWNNLYSSCFVFQIKAKWIKEETVFEYFKSYLFVVYKNFTLQYSVFTILIHSKYVFRTLG